MLAHDSSFGDHPRACGEQAMTATRNGCDYGSSPRMRGAAARHLVPRVQQGIIPAHAGSRWRRRGQQSSTQDHPRACGEQEEFDAWLAEVDGSSPRMRGSACSSIPSSPASRIIPAHAGSSREVGRVVVAAVDHPRACGEQ